jgi:ribose/xylose/arabinose/galactoside ABC-type transport system permease subunit
MPEQTVIEIGGKLSLKRGGAKAFLSEYGILIALVFIVIALSVISPVFLTVDNILNVFRQISINGLLAIGATFVILTRGIDLSVGSIVAFSGVVAASFAKDGAYPLSVAVCVGLLAGLVLGVVNGYAVARWHVAPFIVTLGMMSAARGLTFVYSNGRPIPGLSDQFQVIGNGSFLGIPNPVILLFAVFVISSVILYRTKIGRYIYAIGGNEESAIISGVNVRKVKIFVYSISGLLAGLAGVVLTSRVTSGLPQAGQSYELDAIAAVVIGGTSLSGGKGRLWGTLVGALLIGVINNGLDLLNVSSYYQLIVKGLIIVFAVMIDVRTNK